MMAVRGVRGATVASHDQSEAILSATRELLQAILEANPTMRIEDLASVVFSTTDDLVAVHPAQAAREMGWELVPLMCFAEIPVPGSMACCVRVLLHWNTELPQNAIRHVYLGEAANLRPDLGQKVDN
jgi:chorismate mutase